MIDNNSVAATGAESSPLLTIEDRLDPRRRCSIAFCKDVLVGRGRWCDLVIDDDRTLARRQCTLYMRNGVLYVRNESKRSPLEVNGQRQLPKVGTAIVSGSILVMGSHSYYVYLS